MIFDPEQRRNLGLKNCDVVDVLVLELRINKFTNNDERPLRYEIALSLAQKNQFKILNRRSK